MLVVALIAGLGLTACTPKPVVIIYGDSLIWESQGDIAWLMGDAYDTRIESMGGTALCDYTDRILSDARSIRPAAVVVAFSGNALTPCMQPPAGRANDAAWHSAKYGADLIGLLLGLAPTGVPSIVISPPPTLQRVAPAPPSVTPETVAPAELAPVDVVQDTWVPAAAETAALVLPDRWEYGQRPDGFDSYPGSVVQPYRDVVAAARFLGLDTMLVDGGRLLRAPDGGWTKVAPCLPFEGPEWGCRDGLIDVRGPDLGHFCTEARYGPEGVVAGCGVWSSGEWRYSTAIVEAVKSRLAGTTGSLDLVAAGPGRVTVAGWAFDPRSGTDPSDVHVYVDRAGAAVRADQPRADVGAAYPLAGPDHGFNATLTATPGIHRVCVYAIGAPNVELGCRTVVVPG